jgi:hypothetical protein
MLSHTGYFDGGSYGTGSMQSSYATVGVVNFLRILSSQGVAQLGVGTRIIVEGK